ncbi:MAG: hypothetical protein HWE23_02980 [Rhodobacteraceae bacterium]|nr:hypothetical protein [Paracoccaceae bacterium]
MEDWTENNLKWFFNNIAPLSTAYDEPIFSFLAYCGTEGNQLVSARLLMSPLREVAEDQVVEVGNFLGFKGKVSSLGLDARRLIEALLQFRLPYIDRTILLDSPDNYSSGPSLYRVERGIHQRERNTLDFQLTSSGLCGNFRMSEDDLWRLRASDTPYFSIQDLLNEVSLGTGQGFEILALAPVAIANSSLIEGTQATVQINTASALDENEVHLGVIVHSGESLLERRHFQSSDMTWRVSEINPGIKVGEVKFEVPKASLIHCYANYGERCYNTYWVIDSSTTQNHLRAVLETFDPEFRKTRQLLDQGRGGSNSEGHENAVASLMWMLGFSPINCGKLNEAPDLIGISADGNVLVVECTLGDLKTKRGNKTQNLVDRAKSIREALSKANASFFNCIPVIVSSRSAEDIADDIAECERLGIIAFTRDDLDELLNLTHSRPNSSARFKELQKRIDDQKARLDAKKRKALEMEQSVEEMKRALSANRDEFL